MALTVLAVSTSFSASSSGDSSVWQTIWDQVSTPTSPPSLTAVAIIAAAVLAATLFRPTWLILRSVITIVHEGSHALVALLAGRELGAIKLHSDTSGLTVSRGKPRGFGMVMTAAAGYVGPALTGLLGAWAVAHGYTAAWLWGFVLILAIMLLKIRNFFGLWSLLVTGTIIGLVSLFAPEQIQVYAAYLLVFILLIGAPRPVLELARGRRRDRTRTSDADVLANLTRIPAVLWLACFAILTLGALTLGIWLVIS